MTFKLSCRNNGHIHKADKGGGQLLICVAGRGYYQEWGKEPQELHPGDVVNITPASSTGTALRRIADFPIWRWKYPEKTAAASGVSRRVKKIIKN